MSLSWLPSFCIDYKSTAGNFGQQWPLFPELIFAFFPFLCYKRSHYSMSINLWKKSGFFIYGHELLLLSWNRLGMSSVLNCEIA